MREEVSLVNFTMAQHTFVADVLLKEGLNTDPKMKRQGMAAVVSLLA